TTQGTLRISSSAPSVPGVTTTGGSTSVLTLVGSPTSLDALLPYLEFVPAANVNGEATIALSVSDGTNVVTRQLDVSITAVNDAPQLTLPSGLSTPEDTALTVSGVSVADVDGDSLTVTVSATNGRLNLGSQSGTTVTQTGRPAVLNDLFRM